MLAPGRARDGKNAIGSALQESITIGMVFVSDIAATTASSPLAKITAELLRTNSAASDRIWPCFPSAKWYSIERFFPSTKPSFSKSSRNSLGGTKRASAKNPTRGTFLCCASVTVVVASIPSDATIIQNIRRNSRWMFMIFLPIGRYSEAAIDDLSKCWLIGRQGTARCLTSKHGTSFPRVGATNKCHAANDLFEHSLPREQPASPWGRPELF